MYYFVTRIYRSLKFLFASLGLAGSTLAIIYGSIQTGGTVYIVGGSICLANSIFNFWEVGKVSADILKQINNLKNNIEVFNEKLEFFANKNTQLERSIIQLEEIKDSFVKKNQLLKQNLTSSLSQIDKLEKVKNKYMNLNLDLEKSIQEENGQIIALNDKNKDLQSNLEKVYQVKEEFQKENEEYQLLLKKTEQQVYEVEAINRDLKNQLQSLETNNETLTRQLQEQQELINDSKQLILDLSRFGDRYNQFADTIDTNVIKLENTQDNLHTTTGVLKTLMEKLRGETFENLDQNSDQVVTEEEFNQGLLDLQNPSHN